MFRLTMVTHWELWELDAILKMQVITLVLLIRTIMAMMDAMNLTDDKSNLVHVMAWYRRATSPPRSISPYHWAIVALHVYAHWPRWSWSTFVQVMVCGLFGARPLPEPMLANYQLSPWEQTSVIFESKWKIFNWRLKISAQTSMC